MSDPPSVLQVLILWAVNLIHRRYYNWRFMHKHLAGFGCCSRERDIDLTLNHSKSKIITWEHATLSTVIITSWCLGCRPCTGHSSGFSTWWWQLCLQDHLWEDWFSKESGWEVCGLVGSWYIAVASKLLCYPIVSVHAAHSPLLSNPDEVWQHLGVNHEWGYKHSDD